MRELASGDRRVRELTAAAGQPTRPKPVHPDAVAVMRDRYGLDIAGHRPTRVEDVAGPR